MDTITIKTKKLSDFFGKKYPDVSVIKTNKGFGLKSAEMIVKSFPNLKEIVVPPSVYISNTAMDYLKSKGIKITVKKDTMGRRRKYPEEIYKKVIELYNKGVRKKEISEKLNLPYSTVISIIDRGG